MAAAGHVWQAEKELKRLLAPQETRFRAAAGCFVQAGHVHRRDGDSLQAGRCFARAAALYEQCAHLHDAARTLQLAWEHLRAAGDAASAHEAAERSVQLLLQQHADDSAARFTVEVAAAASADGDQSTAAAAFLRAAQLYGTASPAHAAECTRRAAVALATSHPPDFAAAGRLFARIGTQAFARQGLAAFACHSHFWHSVLCTLASGDRDGARAALDSFMNQDPSFTRASRGIRARALVTATAADAVANALAGDIASPLEAWVVPVLAAVRTGTVREQQQQQHQ